MTRPPLILLATGLLLVACSDSATAPGDLPDFLAAKGGQGKGGGGVYTVEVSPAAASVAVGASVQLTATARDRRGNVIPDVTFYWASSDASLAGVLSTDGLVTGVSAGGPVTITASTGAKKPKSGTAQVTVVAPSGYALDFTTSGVTVPDHSGLDLTTTWTLEAWIKPRAVTGGFQHIVSRWGACDAAAYSMEVNGGRLRSAIASCESGTQEVESYGTLVNDQWQHVAITLDAGTLRLYINGVLDRTYTGSLAPQDRATPVRFGQEAPNLWMYSGLIDEIRMWNVARTEAQLLAAKNTRLTGAETGLVGYWRFDEGTGDVAFDATAHGHDGQLGTAVGPDAYDPAWTTDVPPIP